MTSSTTVKDMKCSCLKSEVCLNPCQKHEVQEPAYRPGPAPKRLRGKCPYERDGCKGAKCRFIKKGCLYSRMKENIRMTNEVFDQLMVESGT
jgi:hypothetical protein